MKEGVRRNRAKEMRRRRRGRTAGVKEGEREVR